MKKVLSGSLLSALFLILVSCGDSEVPYDLNTKKGISQTKKLMYSMFDQKKMFHQVRVSARPRTKQLSSIEASYYFDEESGKIDAVKKSSSGDFKLYEGTGMSFSGNKAEEFRKNEDFIKNFNPQLISKKLEEAKKLLPEQYERVYLGYWIFTADNEHNYTSKFLIQTTNLSEKELASKAKTYQFVNDFYFEVNAKGVLSKSQL